MRRTVSGALVLLMAAGAAVAQHPVAATTIVARDSGAAMHRIAEGVFAIIHEHAVHNYPDGSYNWPHGNTGVVVGNRDVLVIDSDFYPSRAAADIALIRRVTDKPLRYLVNTHWHGDHTHGNATFRKASPALEIVGARENAHWVSLNQARFSRSVTADSSNVRRMLAGHERLLARGADTTGKALSASERALLSKVVDQERTWLREFAAIEVAAPTLLFDDVHRLDLGGRVVELRNWGRANSPADVTVYLPRERVLFTGDIVVHPVPYVFGAYPGPWIGVLRGLEAMPVSAVVPGHGPVFADHSYTKLMRELFVETAARMDTLLRQGKTQDQAQRLLDLGDWRPRFVKDGDIDAAAYWEASIKGGLVERTFQCVVGSRC